MTRNWFSIVAVGVLAAACAEPDPPPSSPAPATVGQPAAAPASPDAQSSAPATPADPMTYNLPPTGPDVSPPGTPSYVIAPGDSVGRRNAQMPRPGGAPAF